MDMKEKSAYATTLAQSAACRAPKQAPEWPKNAGSGVEKAMQPRAKP
jgi:hypothetical protein